MESNTKSYFSGAIVAFLIWTYIYYNINFFKFNYLNTTGNVDTSANTNKYWKTGIYFAVLIILQICISWTVVASNPNCNILKNNGQVFSKLFISTFCPWFFIFGLAIIINIYKSQFKQVFSNTFGYLYAGNDKHLSELLKPKDNQTIIDVYENPSFLINTFTPENLSDKIQDYKNIMKSPYESVSSDFKYDNIPFSDPKNVFKILYDQVESKDKTGEFFWYLYNALFVISIVTYNISLISCK